MENSGEGPVGLLASEPHLALGWRRPKPGAGTGVCSSAPSNPAAVSASSVCHTEPAWALPPVVAHV